MSERRLSAVRPRREAVTGAPKSATVNSRVVRLELLVNGLEEALSICERRQVAMQAQLDHLLARAKADP